MPPPPRVSLRHVDDAGQARDVVGELVLADDERVVVLPAGRGPVEVPRRQIRAMRRVPPRVVRPSSSADDLQHLMGRGWPGVRTTRLGGWSLHEGLGYSQRANSCHPTGTPERALDEAVDAVRAFYTDRGQQPLVQLAGPAGSELDGLLGDQGWEVSSPSLAMVTDLRAHGDATSDAVLRWADAPDDIWLAREPSDHPGRVPVLTSAPAHYATLLVDGQPAGAGRLVLTDGWAGLSCLVVDERLRGRGHGRALAVAMMARARELDAHFGYLQVAEANQVARVLYTSLGFGEHHRYHYRRMRVWKG